MEKESRVTFSQEGVREESLKHPDLAVPSVLSMDTSSNDQMKLHFEFKLDFYNQKLSVWEPIIEKWTPTIDLIRSSFHLMVQ